MTTEKYDRRKGLKRSFKLRINAASQGICDMRRYKDETYKGA